MITNQVTADAVTDALIMMAIAMLITRTLRLAARASAVRRRPLTSARPLAEALLLGAGEPDRSRTRNAPAFRALR
ncbi:hypothetical protein ACFV0T_41645 [Streptomyces sp. NPDC059582]|uniref:hypothetical protein n=1 Tax=Streptomyces sp. NPDC059582 TaxID=3346875 RepID=UPI003697220A